MNAWVRYQYLGSDEVQFDLLTERGERQESLGSVVLDADRFFADDKTGVAEAAGALGVDAPVVRYAMRHGRSRDIRL